MLFHPTTEHKSLNKYDCANTKDAICLCQIHELEQSGQDIDRFYYYADKGRYEKHVKQALHGHNWTQIVLCKRGYERYYLTKRLSKEAIVKRLRFIWVRNRDGFPFNSVSSIVLNGKTDFISDRSARTFFQHVNHLPQEMCLTKKSNLALNLQEYLRKCPAELLSGLKVHPQTYFLQDEYTYNKFFNILKPKVEDTSKSGTDLWIIKPIDSSGGRGITVVKDREDFESKFVKSQDFKLQQIVKLSTSKNLARRELLNANGNEEVPHWAYMNGYLAQKYIYNPLLLEGRKFDFRVYLLIATSTPKICLFFHEGYLRVNIEAYDLSDINNTWSHVSNIGLQKKHPEFEERKLDSKWTFERFEEYLISKNIIKREDNFIEKKLKPEMKQIMKISVKAVESKISVGASEGCFALLGVDFIMDEHLNLWLTEFTKSPAGHASFAKDTLMPDMIAETISILHELEQTGKSPRSVKQSPTGLESVKKFEQIDFYEEK